MPRRRGGVRVNLKEMTDMQLMRVDSKELQTMMVQAGFSVKEMEETKTRRRRLQNRHSARLSTLRRQNKYDSIAKANSKLRSELDRAQSNVGDLASQLEDARMQADRLFRENQELRREIEAVRSMQALPLSTAAACVEQTPVVTCGALASMQHVAQTASAATRAMDTSTTDLTIPECPTSAAPPSFAMTSMDCATSSHAFAMSSVSASEAYVGSMPTPPLSTNGGGSDLFPMDTLPALPLAVTSAPVTCQPDMSFPPETNLANAADAAAAAVAAAITMILPDQDPMTNAAHQEVAPQVSVGLI